METILKILEGYLFFCIQVQFRHFYDKKNFGVFLVFTYYNSGFSKCCVIKVVRCSGGDHEHSLTPTIKCFFLIIQKFTHELLI